MPPAALPCDASTLHVENLTVRRGGKPVLHGISFTVPAGQITTLLGANGAGKSSTVLALAGSIPAAGGTARLVIQGGEKNGMQNINLSGWVADRIRRAGIALVPEGHRVLGQLTVQDNLMVAALAATTAGRRAELVRIYDLFPELAERKQQLAGDLSGGQKQMVAMGQAFIARPRFMLVDELSLGLAPAVVKRLAQALQQAAQEGIGVLMIEQFAHLALKLARHALVLERGKLVFDGTATQLKTHPDILHGAYLSA